VRYYHECVLVFAQIMHYSCQILMKLMNLKFSSTDFQENIQISDFMEILPLEAELFNWTDGQRGMMKPVVALRRFGSELHNSNPSIRSRGHGRFLQVPFQFIILTSSHNSTSRSLKHRERREINLRRRRVCRSCCSHSFSLCALLVRSGGI
jgi:hypothetical protein